MMDSQSEPAAALPDASQRARLRRTRLLRDILARLGVSLAGFAVVGSLALIIIYMFYQAAPAFQAPAVTVTAHTAAQVDEPARLALLQPRQSNHTLIVNAAGEVDVFD